MKKYVLSHDFTLYFICFRSVCGKEVDVEKEMSNEDAETKLHEITVTLEPVRPNTEEHKKVETLVQQTWKFSDRQGQDSRNLSHKGVKIKGIYACPPLKRKEKPISTRENQKYDSPWLINQPVLTQSCIFDVMKEMEDQHPLLQTQLQCQSFETPEHLREIAQVHARTSDGSNQPTVPSAISRNSISSVVSNLHISDSLPCPRMSTPYTNQSTKLAGINSLPLFHGTKIDNIPSILQSNLNVTHAKKGLYGRYIYFAESSEKADQYAGMVSDFLFCKACCFYC